MNEMKAIAKRDLCIGSKIVATKGSTCIIRESRLSSGYSIFSEDGRFLYTTTWWNICADFESVDGGACMDISWREMLIRC